MGFAAVLQRIEETQNPYPGLRPFETREASLFFGRDQQIAELVVRLQRSRFVAVVGVSGSGKSSLVRAGLIPALQRTHVSGAAARWRIVVTRPAGAPFASLAKALQEQGLDPSELRRSSQGLLHVARHLDAEETLLVVVDQFEELFRYKDLQVVEPEMRQQRGAAASEAAEYAQLLLGATQFLPAVFIVLTMRSDYLGDCAEFRGLPEALNECQYLVPRLTRQQRTEVIERPLGQTQIAASLVQRILNDAGDEPDRLPLLQHVLMRTWSQWRRSDPHHTRRIDLQDYLDPSVGGIERALDLHAEEVLKRLTQEQAVSLEIVQKIFKRLTAQGESRHEHRNPSTLAELREVCGAKTEEERNKVDAVIDGFRASEATFLTPREGVIAPEDYIDITHESLIREWRRLREWVTEESAARATFLRMHEDAQLHAQGKGDLWRDPKLQLALDWWNRERPTAGWAKRYLGGGSAGERGFEETRRFLQLSQQGAARSRQLRRAFQYVAIAVGVVIAMLGAVSMYEKHLLVGQQQQLVRKQQQLKDESQSSLARALAFISMQDQVEHPEQLERSTLYAVQSVRIQSAGHRPTPESVHLLQSEVSLLRKQSAHLQNEKAYVWGVAFSADGRYLATAPGKAILYDSSWQKIPSFDDPAAVWALAFSGDGKFMATGGQDGVRMFDVGTWTQVLEITADKLSGRPTAVALSPDARLVAVAVARPGFDVPFLFDRKINKQVWSGSAKVIAACDGAQAKTESLVHIRSVTFSPNGRYLALGADRELLVYDVRNLGSQKWVCYQFPDRVLSVAFSPDSAYVAIGDEAGKMQLYDPYKREEIWQWNLKGPVGAVAFSPDGRYLAAGGDDGVAHVFDLDLRDRGEVLQQAHQNGVTGVAFSPQGRLASSSLDGTVDVVDVKSPDESFPPLSLQLDPQQIAVGVGARYGAVIDGFGFARVFEFATGKEGHAIVQLLANQVAVSADGQRIALAGGLPPKATVFDASNGRVMFKIPTQRVTHIDLTADGRLLAVGDDTGLQVFDASDGHPVWPKHRESISAISFSPAGQQLVAGIVIDKAVGSTAAELQVFDTEAGTSRRIPVTWNADKCKYSRQPCQVTSITFSTDGQRVVVTANDETTRVFDMTSGSQVVRVDLPGEPVAGALSEDNRYLAVSSEDLMGRVYELPMVEGTPAREVWHVVLQRGSFFPLAFADKDKYILWASGRKHLIVNRILWHAPDLVERACDLLTRRNMTPEEWSGFSRDELPRTCPERPVVGRSD